MLSLNVGIAVKVVKFCILKGYSQILLMIMSLPYGSDGNWAMVINLCVKFLPMFSVMHLVHALVLYLVVTTRRGMPLRESWHFCLT